MKIAIVVHGRFHAFDLARALIQRGNDITVFTNYPKWAARRFGLPGQAVRSYWPHGIAAKGATLLNEFAGVRYPEALLHTKFGNWAASELKSTKWDVIHCFSGVAEEVYQTPQVRAGLRLVVRASCHIRTQAKLLSDEERRAGVLIDKPSDWRIRREEREYDLADRVLVLSSFSRNSFLEQGYPGTKLLMFLPGVRSQSFRPDISVIQDRCRRIIAGEPLRVLYVGNLSFQKGMLDAISVINRLDRGRFRFRFVGTVLPEVKEIVHNLKSRVDFIGRQPERELTNTYAWGDVFFFPTIQDGFPQVVVQALANGLPVLTTVNCSGPDIIGADGTGWVVPARDPEAMADQLMWCDAHRLQLARMVRYLHSGFRIRDWQVASAEFEAMCEQERDKITRGPHPK